jgi:acetyl esterase/lipase
LPGFRKRHYNAANANTKPRMKRLLLAALLGLALLAGLSIPAQEEPKYTRTEDVIYGRKFGTALTLDVFEPEKKNGAAIFFMVSGGFFSDHKNINPSFYRSLLEHGYTVFAVVHGSQPRFIIPEIEEDIHRAIRFVRHNASRWGVDTNKFGITGASAGGHLSLTIGTQGKPGKADAKDAIDRESSAVQAVACFFPPTDFLNWSKPGEDGWDYEPTRQFSPAFGPRWTTHEGRQVMGREISPIYFVTSNMPPTLVLHGDADKLVPIYQSQMFEKKCKEAGAPFKLIVKSGADHGWAGMDKDMAVFADWFDEHLRGIKAKE